jgi:hypothetical protein
MLLGSEEGGVEPKDYPLARQRRHPRLCLVDSEAPAAPNYRSVRTAWGLGGRPSRLTDSSADRGYLGRHFLLLVIGRNRLPNPFFHQAGRALERANRLYPQGAQSFQELGENLLLT